MENNERGYDNPFFSGEQSGRQHGFADVDELPPNSRVDLKAIRQAIARVEAEAKATVAAENRARAETQARALAEERARTDAEASAEAHRSALDHTA